MTKKIMKTLAVAMCAVLLVAGSIAGTMAYLTSTATVSNTFTAGKVAITLEETDQQASYKLIPGKTYTKDPTITVSADSEDCYLFVKVENGIAEIEAGANSVNAQMSADNTWTGVNGSANIFYYKEKVSAGAKIKVFETFTIAAEKTGDEIAPYNEKQIVVTAYAVQADGFDTAQAAWNATFGA